MNAADQPRAGEHPSASTTRPGKVGIVVDLVVLAAMLALAFFGIATADAEWQWALPYWSLLALLYGLGAMALAWIHHGERFRLGGTAVRLAAHWAGALAVVHLVFYVHANDQLTEGQSGLVLGIVFALATFLCGVHVQWRMMLIGAALAAAAAMAALVEENLWLLLAIAVGALVAVLAFDFLRRGRTG
jgi:hypothetical protein